jgi:hypothetical protein
VPEVEKDLVIVAPGGEDIGVGVEKLEAGSELAGGRAAGVLKGPRIW